MTGAVRAGRLPSHRAEVALRPRGPAHRRSDARARPAPVAAAPPRATDVRPPADLACRHTRASRRGPRRSPRRVARRRAARADPGVLTLKSGSTAASIRQTDASASHGRRRPRVADRTCLWAIAGATGYSARPRSGRLLFGEALVPEAWCGPWRRSRCRRGGVRRVLPRDSASRADRVACLQSACRVSQELALRHR